MSKKVFVGLSGGVDSSVAAAILLEAGYDVTGVFIKVWHPDFLPCNWEEERVDAMRVAAHLGIPFRTCDGEVAYRDKVAHYFIESYRAGLTPNPDVLCNQEVKFGVFMDYALNNGADFVATGHYARVTHAPDGSATLLRGVDTEKDQSYFLWSLSSEQLRKTLFPIGHLTKPELRIIAEKLRLPTASKKDSQGVCFLGHVDIPEFLSHYTSLENGSVLDETGDSIGTHRGAVVYTIGQRHGFTITNATDTRNAYYITDKNISRNTLTVSTKPPRLYSSNIIKLENVKIRSLLQKGQVVEMQTRYRQNPIPAQIVMVSDSGMQLQVQEETEAVAKGQSCVLYAGDVCHGGGMIA
jgi:tRNA-uridine 2-sulfurtransferase